MKFVQMFVVLLVLCLPCLVAQTSTQKEGSKAQTAEPNSPAQYPDLPTKKDLEKIHRDVKGLAARNEKNQRELERKFDESQTKAQIAMSQRTEEIRKEIERREKEAQAAERKRTVIWIGVLVLALVVVSVVIFKAFARPVLRDQSVESVGAETVPAKNIELAPNADLAEIERLAAKTGLKTFPYIIQLDQRYDFRQVHGTVARNDQNEWIFTFGDRRSKAKRRFDAAIASLESQPLSTESKDSAVA